MVDDGVSYSLWILPTLHELDHKLKTVSTVVIVLAREPACASFEVNQCLKLHFQAFLGINNSWVEILFRVHSPIKSDP